MLAGSDEAIDSELGGSDEEIDSEVDGSFVISIADLRRFLSDTWITS